MEIINKHVVLKRDAKLVLAGGLNDVTSFNDEYEIIFEGTKQELEDSEYFHLMEINNI